MKGLKLAEAYYHDIGAPMIERLFPHYIKKIAAGFVGPGSECFGFDDHISRDHDWGPGFCLWLPHEIYIEIGKSLQEEYDKLPEVYKGYGPRKISEGEEGRIGVNSIPSFYRLYTGLDHYPEEINEWIRIPEQSLATCTNGKVFTDPLGLFSHWRNHLLGFYPEDLRLKKIASRCANIAQTGQYNWQRSLDRNAYYAALYSEIKFSSEVISLVFLLNRRYKPFYKWEHRAVKDLQILGKTVYSLIESFFASKDQKEKKALINQICERLITELQNQGLSDARGDFLLDHAHNIHTKIKDEDNQM